MTDVSDLFPSKYLKASDATPPVTVTITRLSKEKMKNKEGVESEKNVIFFSELEKGMVLNITNANTLANLFGSDTDTWIGEHVILGTEIVTAFGESKPALRFKNEDVGFSHDDLVKRYFKLYDEACVLEVEDIDTFVLPKDATDATIIELGKLLRGKVEASKAF
jgi:hypothetical protein